MEIITGVERRRRWRLEEKLRIVAEAEAAGAWAAAGAAGAAGKSAHGRPNGIRPARYGSILPEGASDFVG